MELKDPEDDNKRVIVWICGQEGQNSYGNEFLLNLQVDLLKLMFTVLYFVMSVSVSVSVTSESKKHLIYVVTVHNSILVMLFPLKKEGFLTLAAHSCMILKSY